MRFVSGEQTARQREVEGCFVEPNTGSFFCVCPINTHCVVFEDRAFATFHVKRPVIWRLKAERDLFPLAGRAHVFLLLFRWCRVYPHSA